MTTHTLDIGEGARVDASPAPVEDETVIGETPVSIILVTYCAPGKMPSDIAAHHIEREQHFAPMLQDLEEKAHWPHELVIISNGDRDHDAKLVVPLRRLPPIERIILNYGTPRNLPESRGPGAYVARYPLLCFLDDDLDFEDGWLRRMVACLDETDDPANTIVSGFVLEGRMGYEVVGPAPGALVTLMPTDGCCLLHRRLYYRLGGYMPHDPRRPFPIRCRDARVECLVPVPAPVRHWGAEKPSWYFRSKRGEGA